MIQCRKTLWSLLLVLVPVAVWGAESGNSGFSLLGSLIQMFAALAVVIGLILLFYYVANRWLKSSHASFGQPRYIRVVETRYVTPKKSLMLVEVGGEYLLLANSGDQMNLIKHIDMLEEIEVLEIPGEEKPGGAFRAKLQEFMQKIPKTGARAVPCNSVREDAL